MESSGEEKKLQALFSELRAGDEQTAPGFAAVWNRAQPARRRARFFHPAFVAAAGLVVCAVLSIVVWSRYRPQPETDSMVHAEPTLQPDQPATTAVKNDDATVQPIPGHPAPIPRRNKRASRRYLTQTAINRKLTRDARAITDWQSPTSTLLSSSSDELFGSLPQLNENSSGLQSFLPNRPN